MSSRSATEQHGGLTTSDLRVYLLGPPEVERAGQPISISRRQARALLFRLAARPQPVSREQLSFLFWPDAPESTARRNLSRLLTHLRRALPATEMFFTADDRISLDPDQIWSDTVAFERLCVSSESQSFDKARPVLSEAEMTSFRIETLQRAVDLYRGPFLAGFCLPGSPEFEAWVLREQRFWERLYLQALADLIEGQTTSKAYDAAIACAQRYLATDELAEDVHRRLIELYAATGDRHAALRQFERCSVVLERELGVSPLPETRGAYRAVLEDRSPPLPHAPPRPVWMTMPGLDAPLVGRDEVLRQLEQAYVQVRSGHGKVILISGEPGIGKSRLLQDFVTGLVGQATVLVGGSHETEQGLPYWPLIEALQSHVPAIDWTTFDIEPLYLAEVARLLPELRTFLPNLPAPAFMESGLEQGRLFQALAHWLLRLAAQRPPLILCLDDLHWADATTLSWLGYLTRRLKHASVLVLGAYRTEGMATVAALRAELVRLGALEEVRLEGLPQTEVSSLVRHLSGQTSSVERLSQRLHRETGGNPFFLLETLRAMFEAGTLWQDETGWSTDVDETTRDYRELPLPDTVDQAIQDRLGRLSPQTRQVVEAGAVLGHQFDFDLVQATSGRHESELVDALDILLARQVISEQKGKYRFNHDLTRTVIYRGLSYGRRRLLHQRAGEALQKHRPDDVAALARHFEQAEVPGQAARYAWQAGLVAKAVFAHAEARLYFDRALACLEQEATHLRESEALAANQRLRIQALDGRGWTFRLLGDMEAYARDSSEVARLAELLGDQATLAHLHWRKAYTHRWFCHYAQAKDAAEEGLHLSQTASDPLLEAMCQREVGMAARETGDYRRAELALERSLRLFVDLGEIVYEIHTLGNLSTLHWYEGEYKRAMNLARQALTRCDEAELSLERRLPLGDIGAAAAASGDVDLARQSLQESLDIARQITDRTQEILCLSHLGWLYLGLKQPIEALEHLLPALDLAERIGSCTEQSRLLAGLAEAHRLAAGPSTGLELVLSLPKEQALKQAITYARRAMALAQANGRTYDQEHARRILNDLGVS